MKPCPDKRARVERLLAHPLWGRRSTNWIARAAGVSWAFADRVRQRRGDRPGRVETRSGRVVSARHNRKDLTDDL